MLTTIPRILVIACLALAASAAAAHPQGQTHGWVGGAVSAGHSHHGNWGVGIGFGWPLYPYGPWDGPYGPWAPYGAYPGTIVAEPVPAPGTWAPVRPDPVFVGRNGQDATQTEADRQDCNRFATTQPSAMADAIIFHRTMLRCMEGRGYSVR